MAAVVGLLRVVVQRVVRLGVIRVVQHRVALGEGAALGVLAGEADKLALLRQGTEGEQLAPAPVDVAVGERAAALLQHGLQALVRREVLRQVRERVGEALELVLGDVRVQAAGELLRLGDAGLLARLALLRLDVGEDGIQLVVEVLCCLLCVFLGDVAAADEVLGVAGAHRRVGLDAVVHDRLGHRRVVGLVVAAQAVADQVDEDVLAKLAAVLGGQLGNPGGCLRIVAVDVEHRAVEALG